MTPIRWRLRAMRTSFGGTASAGAAAASVRRAASSAATVNLRTGPSLGPLRHGYRPAAVPAARLTECTVPRARARTRAEASQYARSARVPFVSRNATRAGRLCAPPSARTSRAARPRRGAQPQPKRLPAGAEQPPPELEPPRLLRKLVNFWCTSSEPHSGQTRSSSLRKPWRNTSKRVAARVADQIVGSHDPPRGWCPQYPRGYYTGQRRGANACSRIVRCHMMPAGAG